jgi:hypothetical protein
MRTIIPVLQLFKISQICLLMSSFIFFYLNINDFIVRKINIPLNQPIIWHMHTLLCFRVNSLIFNDRGLSLGICDISHMSTLLHFDQQPISTSSKSCPTCNIWTMKRNTSTYVTSGSGEGIVYPRNVGNKNLSPPPATGDLPRTTKWILQVGMSLLSLSCHEHGQPCSIQKAASPPPPPQFYWGEDAQGRVAKAKSLLLLMLLVHLLLSRISSILPVRKLFLQCMATA